MNEEFKAQKLTLSPNSDEKMWVAEIVGDDPVYRLKRVFLPEFEKGVYHIYDGVYQIHGIYPGISPFNKEYCIVRQGHMQRKIPLKKIYQLLPQIQLQESSRMSRLKHQINEKLDTIGRELDHELVWQDIYYQKDQLDSLEDSQQLTLTLGQLIKHEEKMVDSYKKAIERSIDW
ncbi:hypothetical protein [Facklamia sp. 7083-14-GEN3]|uniref:hypothetical protein n=1 Tax=Facklamia sp. 7083-14-GEN3 TaxID=2973478 RepID=UPI00215C1170|nr:hypothetical protein [Facklamia sp. 7083-14-GEN3]MCR8968543.1 hypothetical protein [Facklamia sp. 7083-14-GEN3]